MYLLLIKGRGEKKGHGSRMIYLEQTWECWGRGNQRTLLEGSGRRGGEGWELGGWEAALGERRGGARGSAVRSPPSQCPPEKPKLLLSALPSLVALV